MQDTRVLSFDIAERANPPIARLNADVLRVVFTFVADVEGRPRYPRHDTWVRIGHVCRLWRTVLLDMAHLWARDLFSFPKGFTDILPRTREAPLDLNLFESGIWRTDRKLIDLAFPLFDRARLLTCYLTSAEDTLFMAESLHARSIPHLQELRLFVHTQRSANFRIPHLHLAEHPKLHHLSMSNIFLRPSVCSELVTLEISLDNYGEEFMPSSSVLIDILAKSPRLQTFSLLDWIEMRDAATVQTAPEVLVQMAELTEITLRLGNRERNILSPTGTLQNFLTPLRLPALTRADIADFSWPNDIPVVQSTVKMIFTVCASSLGVDHDVRVSAAHGLHDANQNLFQFDLREFRQSPGRGKHLCVSLQSSATSSEIEDTIPAASVLNQALHSHGVVRRVKCVDWSAHSEFSSSPAYWQAAFARLDGVEMIYVRGDGLCPLAVLAKQASPNSIWLPALRGIILDDRYLQHITATMPNDLHPLIRIRAAIGVPIYALCVEGIDLITDRDFNAVRVGLAIMNVSRQMGVGVDLTVADEETSEWGECGTSARFTYPETEVGEMMGEGEETGK